MLYTVGVKKSDTPGNGWDTFRSVWTPRRLTACSMLRPGREDNPLRFENHLPSSDLSLLLALLGAVQYMPDGFHTWNFVSVDCRVYGCFGSSKRRSHLGDIEPRSIREVLLCHVRLLSQSSNPNNLSRDNTGGNAPFQRGMHSPLVCSTVPSRTRLLGRGSRPILTSKIFMRWQNKKIPARGQGLDKPIAIR